MKKREAYERHMLKFLVVNGIKQPLTKELNGLFN